MLTHAEQATYRPLVERAWRHHCEVMGHDPDDRLARETWYRAQVHGATGHWSTREVSPGEEFQALLRRFRLLVSEASPAPIAGWTDRQNEQYADLVMAAWGKVLMHDHRISFNAWMAARLEECGILAGRAPDRTKSFDAAMAVFAVIAGDLYWMDRTASAAERRIKHVLSELMAELSRIECQPVGWSYVVAMLEHMNLPTDLDAIPANLLWKALQALDTHVRRLQHKAVA